MLDDPIVIRKSRGALVVSSSVPTDPIQLVREIAPDQLEVHLKNGTKYVEEVEHDQMQEIILEMMGYGVVSVLFGFHAWPENQSGTLQYYTQEHELRMIGEKIVSELFSQTPYMNSKFLSLELEDVVEHPDIKYYDSTYSQYDFEYSIRFRARVDAAKKIEHEFDKQCHSFSKYFFMPKRGDRVLSNECWVNVEVEE